MLIRKSVRIYVYKEMRKTGLIAQEKLITNVFATEAPANQSHSKFWN
jgi:hypothetical protein